MRDILFRGKSIETGEWAYGNLVIAEDNVNAGKAYILPHVTAICVVIGPDDNTAYDIGRFIEVDPVTVGQYTGLTDSNGKKVFEGDILEVTYRTIHEHPTSYRHVCEYLDGSFILASIPDRVKIGNVWAWCNYPFKDQIVEDVGNIHDMTVGQEDAGK